MMMHSRTAALFLIYLVLSAVGCGFGTIRESGGAQVPTIPSRKEYLKAAGDELVLRIDRAAVGELWITVTNRSPHSVFLPYDPGSLPDDFAVYVGFETEKLNVATGIFEVFGGAHLGPRTHRLNPGASFKYRHPIPDRGTFRLKLGYTIDKRLSDRLSELAFIDSVEAKKEEIDEAQRLIGEYCGLLVSPPIEIS